jgi:hypothetical protein
MLAPESFGPHDGWSNLAGARKSSDGGGILNGMRTDGTAEAKEVEVGTGGPLEAGTLSEAGTPIPFGEILATG